MPTRAKNGYSLIELLIVLAIIGMFVGIALPSLGTITRRAALRSAATQLRTIFHKARMRAIARHASCGVKFFVAGGEWQYALYDDGDGDGIRNDDINRGIDRRASESRRALPESSAISFGVLPRRINDPDGDRLLPDASPVQFGRSTICSFSPLGESTSGTIYLTDRRDQLLAVRVYGVTAKIRTLRFDGRKWVAR